MRTVSKLLANEGINTAATLALSGAIIVSVAKRDGPVSLKRMMSGMLSNPVPRRNPTSALGTEQSFKISDLRVAA